MELSAVLIAFAPLQRSSKKPVARPFLLVSDCADGIGEFFHSVVEVGDSFIVAVCNAEDAKHGLHQLHECEDSMQEIKIKLDKMKAELEKLAEISVNISHKTKSMMDIYIEVKKGG